MPHFTTGCQLPDSTFLAMLRMHGCQSCAVGLKWRRVGILEEYVMDKGKKLDGVKARALLERAKRIVAHNSSGDQSLLERELPGTEKSKWLCSFRGIEWK